MDVVPEETSPRSFDEEDVSIDVGELDAGDLAVLAQEVYALLRQELRLERDRQGGQRIW